MAETAKLKVDPKGAGCLVLMIGAGLVWMCSPAKAPSEMDMARSALQAQLGPEVVSDCRMKITRTTQAGLIRERPEPKQINVDERIWAEMPMSQKEQVMKVLSCDVYGQYLPPEGSAVRAVGWRSGERLLSLTDAGFM